MTQHPLYPMQPRRVPADHKSRDTDVIPIQATDHDPPAPPPGSKNFETVKNYRQKRAVDFTRAGSVMGTVVNQNGGCRTAVNYYKALNKHPIRSNGLPRILMAAFAR